MKAAVTVASLVVGAGTFLAAGPAQAASGGGCEGPGGAGSVTLTACISASGLDVIPDGYASIHGSTGSGCYIQVNLLDANRNYVTGSRPQSCSNGHHVGPSGDRLGTYYSEVCVTYSVGATPYHGCAVSYSVTVP